MLTGGPRDLPARQQTLRNTIAWSYALLEPAEQAIFRRLALFAGSFDLDAVEAVCAADGGAGPDVLAGVEALLDKSLIRRAAPGPEADEMRFEMLAVVREFALELLEQDADRDHRRAGFVAYYAGLAEQAGDGWRSAAQNRWLRWLQVDEGNVRQALAWALADDAPADLTSTGVAILFNVDRYWRQMARITETRRLVDHGLAHAELSDTEQARLLTLAGFYGMLAGEDPAAVMGYHERALGLAQHVEDELLLIDVLESYGIDAAKARMNDKAKEVVGQAMLLERQRAGGMTQRLASQMNILATVHRDLWELDEALAIFEEVLAYTRVHGNTQQLAAILTNVANVARPLGDFDRDAACLREVWEIVRATGDTLGGLTLLSAVAERAHMQHRPALSVRLHSAELTLARQLGVVFPPAYQHEFDAYMAEAHARLDDAAFAAAWSAGEHTDVAEAVELGLGAPDAG